MENAQPSGELEVWIKFAGGDNKALEIIYRTYYTQLYNYGFRWLRDAALVEDCIQDLFTKLMRNRAGLAVPQSVRNYLFSSLRMMALDKLRSRSYGLVSMDEEKAPEFPLEFDADGQMIRTEEERLRFQKLQAAINELTPRQREAVYLRYVKGMSYEEVSKMLDLTPKATYKLVARALAALRDIVLFWAVVLTLKIFF